MFYLRTIEHSCYLEVVVFGKSTADNILVEGDADVITHAQDTIGGLRHAE